MSRARRPRPYNWAQLPRRECWGWPGLPQIVDRLEAERLAALPTHPPPAARTRRQWYEHIAGLLRGLTSARLLDLASRGRYVPPAHVENAVCLLLGVDLYDLWGREDLRPHN